MLRIFVFVCITASFFLGGLADVFAATRYSSSKAKPISNKRYAAIVVDTRTGQVLMSSAADSHRYPASLTKIMTMYMAFEAIKHGRLSLRERIRISHHAASMPPSKLGLKVGSRIRVEDAIKALATKSANDIAAALAERIAGTESAFAVRMTRKARQLGMHNTTFKNASGLPNSRQVTTARDMATLAMALLRDFPNRYHYFGIRSFKYKGHTYGNHNKLLGKYSGLDGIKTGYINASGFNLVASAKRGSHRLIGVVFGGYTGNSRNKHMVKLLDQGFRDVRARRSDFRQASLGARVPVPPLSPVRNASRYMADKKYDNTTDSAEEEHAYSQSAADKINALVASRAVRAKSFGREAASNVPKPAHRPLPAGGSASLGSRTANTPPVPATSPINQARTPRTVMQLRIPRDQLPQGISGSQIANAQNEGWSIQVGAFPSRAMTDKALRTAQAILPANLQSVQPLIVPKSTSNGVLFRARLQGYSQIQAEAACAHLSSCLVVSPGS